MISVALFFICADLVAKHFVAGIDQEVIPGFFKFFYTQNTGAAWSIFSGSTTALLVVSIIAVIALLAYSIFRPIKSKFFYVAIGFIIGGAVGNMVDRIAFGYVRDFIKLQFINFPIFNIADSALTVGVVLLCIYLLISSIKEIKKEKKNGKENDN